jgi:DNA-directed RNA polymerase beta subunit
MEKDATLAHGAAMMLQDKLFNCSDKCVIFLCDHCGSVADAPPPKRVEGTRGTQPYCRRCNDHESPRRVEIPYATKLLFQELQAMHITVLPKLERVP